MLSVRCRAPRLQPAIVTKVHLHAVNTPSAPRHMKLEYEDKEGNWQLCAEMEFADRNWRGEPLPLNADAEPNCAAAV